MLKSSVVRWRQKARQRFVDNVKVLVSSGAGGDGASIMAHEHGNEFAGPGGGNGGNGGNVMLRCTRHCTDLAHIKDMGVQIQAGHGSCGYSREAHGKRGRDLWLDLPVGTEVVDVDTNEALYDLDEEGVELLLLEGGQGGKGNAAFANKWHHSPTESTRGLPGNTLLAQIELKTIADCGLVGYPNAGKSSLLSAISASKPEVAPYAFTTLRPYVGVLHDLYGNTCRVADTPGLIEGAYENRGLGHQFLRHIERTKTIAFVVDMCSTYDPNGGAEEVCPWDVVERLEHELEYYLPGLSRRAVMVFANKMDLEHDSAGTPMHIKLETLKQRVRYPVFPVSAALGIALGPQHPQTGLTSAVQFLCAEVLGRKTRDSQLEQRRRDQQRWDLDQVFRQKNNGLFTPERVSGDEYALAGSDTDLGSMDGASEVSLVDQQLGSFGESGYGGVVDGYSQSASSGKLLRYRDLTMKGKYWSLTRQEGEKVEGEKWK